MTAIDALTARRTAIQARQEELLTVKEFAALTRVAERTIYRRLRTARQAGAVRVGGAWRIDVSLAIRSADACPNLSNCHATHPR